MGEHANVQLLRDGYAAFARGDIDEATKNWAPGIVWHISGTSELAGDYKGQEEIVGMFGRLFELTSGNFELEIHDLLANDDHAVALVHERAQREGRTLEADNVHVFHLKDGKVTEFWSASTDERAQDEFWA